MRGARRRGLRDRGLLARAGAAPRRRDPLRRRRLHQPHPGPPRLPSDDGGLLRGQAAAVQRASSRACRRRGRRSSTSTTRTAPGWRPSSASRSRSRCALPAPTTAATELETGLDGSSFTVHTPDGPLALRSPLRGEFNVYNVIGALAVARALGRFRGNVRGGDRDRRSGARPLRDRRRGPAVRGLVDYAHTPDSLENVLRAARGADAVAAAGRVRLRRRPRSRQAPADGRDRPSAGRRRVRHLRQPPLGGSRGDHRRDPRGRRHRGRPRPRPSRRDRPGDRVGAGRATSS